MNIVEKRRKSQLDFLQSKQEIEVGKKSNLPLSIEEILKINSNSSCVEEVFSSGLTAIVYKININKRFYNLKKKRENILVKNVDGQTSFLNEVQRRKNFFDFKSTEPENFSHIVDTVYASLNNGFILSEWIEGEKISHFTEKNISDIFKTHLEIEKKGLFECDLSLGNLLLDKNNEVRFFDFGYMYPYNPLIHYNSDGKELPIFHLCERLESRSLMQYLMDLENQPQQMMQTYETTKKLALETYLAKLHWLEKNNAAQDVIDWQKSFIKLWEFGLLSQSNLLNVYELESFRSYVLDVHDDISGKSCTPLTIKKIDKIIEKIKSNFTFLKSQNGLFWGDETLSFSDISNKYLKMREKVIEYQIK